MIFSIVNCVKQAFLELGVGRLLNYSDCDIRLQSYFLGIHIAMFRYADIRTELEREPQISVSEVRRSAAARATTSVAHLAFAQLPFPSPAGTARTQA